MSRALSCFPHLQSWLPSSLGPKSICPLQQTLKIVERPLNIGPTLDLSVPQDR